MSMDFVDRKPIIQVDKTFNAEYIKKKGGGAVIMVLDTETTGLPVRTRESNMVPDPRIRGCYANARLVEIGYIIAYANDPLAPLIKKANYIIKPLDYIIPLASSKVHGIKHACAAEYGQDVKIVLDTLKADLAGVDCIVCHNAVFDINVVAAECYVHGLYDLGGYIENMPRVCTMRLGAHVLNLTKPYIKLKDLYEKLHNGEVCEQTHRALSDAMHCLACYYALMKICESKNVNKQIK